jgi:energy-coupling factor transport system permease protein
MLEYIHQDSLIHKLHPLTKLFWAVVVMVISLIFNNPWYLTIIILTVVIVGFIGKVGKETLVYLSALILIASFVFFFQILFRPEGDLLFTVFPASWPIVGGWLPVTDMGLRYGFAMSLRMMALVSVLPVILTTTQPRDIVMALVEDLHVPYDYAFMFTTALRFMPVILSEVSTISQAQRSRAYATEGWNPLRKLQAFAPIAMPIVFIAIEKADRLGLCMELRGYGSPNRTYLRQLSLTLMDWGAMAFMILVVILSFIASTQGYGRIELLALN